MIRDYQTPSRRSACLAIGAITLLAVLGLTKPPAAHPQDGSQAGATATNEVPNDGHKQSDVPARPQSFEVKGRCLDDDGKPLAGAEVWLFHFDRYGAHPKQKWHQKTGKTGDFRFERLKPLADIEQQEHYLVAARKPKHSSAARLIFVGTTPVDLDLKLSTDVGTLSGRVTDENGAPLAGAQVYLSVGKHPLPEFLHDVTDEDGRYSIPDFKCWNAADTERFDPKSGTTERMSHCYFRVKHPDYPLTMGSYTAIPQEVNVQLKPGITIEGRVVDVTTDKAAANVVVVAQGLKQHGGDTVTTDKQGMYRLSLTPDLYNIWAQVDDRTCIALDSFNAPVGKVSKAPDLNLVEGGFFVGKVVDKATGRPVTKLPDGQAIYVAHYGPARPKSGAAVSVAAVQNDGTYRLRVAPGPNYPYLMHDVEAERTPRNATSLDPFMVREGETVTLDFHVSPRSSEVAQEDEVIVAPQRQRRTRPLGPAPDKEAFLRNIAKPTRERADTEVGRLLNRLSDLRHRLDLDEFAVVLRDLIQLGPAVVPELIAEMDATDDEFMLRCLAFVMRGIGDKRTVPALIRALPKTCVSPRSDYGLRAKDPDLLAFMQKYDHSNRNEPKLGYFFGRAITEFCSTLPSLTGVTHGEDEIRSVFLQGSARQQFLQRSQYQRVAERWAQWWEKNWKQHIDDPQYAKVNLPPLSAEKQPTSGFPHGANVAMEGGSGNCLLESVRRSGAHEVFYDLDTGRISGLPQHLRSPAGQPERLDDIQAWAAREGFDLMGTEYTPPGSDTSHYVLRGLGLTAWQIETDRWETLSTEIQEQQPFEMGRRTDGLLADFDAAQGRYRPEETATFLFRTREGGHGAIFVGVEVHDDSLKPGGVGPANNELSPIAFNKGRRFAYSLIVENDNSQSSSR